MHSDLLPFTSRSHWRKPQPASTEYLRWGSERAQKWGSPQSADTERPAASRESPRTGASQIFEPWNNRKNNVRSGSTVYRTTFSVGMRKYCDTVFIELLLYKKLNKRGLIWTALSQMTNISDSVKRLVVNFSHHTNELIWPFFGDWRLLESSDCDWNLLQQVAASQVF